MNLIEKVKAGGVVGAGGAGFPTHIKIDTSADVVIANGAECEPLLQADQWVMQTHATEIVEALGVVMEHIGAKEGVICTKKHYGLAVKALNAALKDKDNIRLLLMESYYPAGDEQTMVHAVMGKVVPTGGLPLDVGAVVVNVTTLKNIALAMTDTPVTHKIITVAGEVKTPQTLKIPVGTAFREIIKYAGGPADESDYALIVGGPCMGKLSDTFDGVVTKTTGGLIVLDRSHIVVDQKTDNFDRDAKLAKAVCCQCSLCTQMCPRNAMGLNVNPHKAMRAVANGRGDLLMEVNGIFSCCDCYLCTTYACNFGLNPAAMMGRIKAGLRTKGVKPKKEVYTNPNSQIELLKIPVSRLVNRMGIKKYEVETDLKTDFPMPAMVKLLMNQHIGAPAVPCVAQGQKVKQGDLIGTAQEGKLSANVHASINGEVSEVRDGYVAITHTEG